MSGPALSPSVAEYQRVPQGRSDCHCRLAQAVVVQDADLFDPTSPTVLVVPMTGDLSLAIEALTVVLQPSPSNGCKKVSYLLPQNLTCVSKARIATATGSEITPGEMQLLRQLVVRLAGAKQVARPASS